MRSLLKRILFIRHQIEIDVLQHQLHDAKFQLNDTKLRLDNLLLCTQKKDNRKKIPNGHYVYIVGTSESAEKFRIGRTLKPNARTNQHSASCLENEFLHYVECNDHILYETIIHSILSKFRDGKTEWFYVSFQVAKVN